MGDNAVEPFSNGYAPNPEFLEFSLNRVDLRHHEMGQPAQVTGMLGLSENNQQGRRMRARLPSSPAVATQGLQICEPIGCMREHGLTLRH